MIHHINLKGFTPTNADDKLIIDMGGLSDGLKVGIQKYDGGPNWVAMRNDKPGVHYVATSAYDALVFCLADALDNDLIKLLAKKHSED